MKRFLISILLSCAWPAVAQQGSYFLSHHAPSEESFYNVCFDMVQDHYGIMYFAVKAGVLEFDGHGWDLIPAEGAVYGLSRNEAGEVFWAGARGFGKILTAANGRKQLHVLSDSTVTNVFQTLSTGGQTYFLSENKIFLYRGGKASPSLVVAANAQNGFTGMFELFGVVYVQTERNATFKVNENKLVFADLNFTGHVLFQDEREGVYILGTDDNRLYKIGANLKAEELPIKDQPYADANIVVAGSWINDNLFALGTLRGGVMLINPATGERDQIIDYSTGLPDNEVFDLMTDANQNVWIAHDYGFTQVAPGLPFRSFSYYAGLEGNLLCAYSLGNDVYVGTSLGLYKLGKHEVYDEIISFIDTPTNAPEPVAQPEDASSRRGVLGFLRRKRNNEGEEPGESESRGTRMKREMRIDRVLRSSEDVFRKVEGINAKVTHLVNANGRLVAAGLEGVFEVEDMTASPIMYGPVRHIQASADQAIMLVATYRDEVSMLHYEKGWQQVQLLKSLGDQIDYMFEGPMNEWWLCGLDQVHRIELANEEVTRLQRFDMPNANFERTVGLYANDRVILVNSNGFFALSTDGKTLTRIDSLPKPYQYFAVNGQVLYRDDHRWNKIGGSGGPFERLQFLNLFPNLRYITTDEDPADLWIISGGNDLLKFGGSGVPAAQSRFPIFLKSVYSSSATITDFREIAIDQSSSAVTFEVVQPDFINPKGIEFRYFLEGMHQHWSDWSSLNNKISFPYLPPGEYKLRVQARNIFGRTSELSPIPFEVIPPYWKQPWFYAMEFMVFASLVVLSFRLSTRYRIVSRFLSLVTIILLIEFIQTAIGASIVNDDSPVVEFLIQFAVAILIFPVEGFLRNLMLRSLESSGGSFYRLMTGLGDQKKGKKPRRKRAVKETI